MVTVVPSPTPMMPISLDRSTVTRSFGNLNFSVMAVR